jgi:curved DNA-binding protein CbpA
MAESFTEILGVLPIATYAEIRIAYHRAAKKCHPDAGGSQEQMIAVIAAWKILSDRGRKETYDAARASAASAAAQAQWNAVHKAASEAASVAASEYGRSPEEFVAWVEQVATEVDKSTFGRAASGAIIGLIMGAVLGAVIAVLLGVSAISGSVVGGVAAAVGGFFAARSREPLAARV